MAVQWFTAMPDYPPLTPAQLRELYHQNPSPECRRLLWEVDRLHERMAEICHFLYRMHGAGFPSELLVEYSQLLAAVEAEPGARRRRGDRGPMLQPPAVLACSMVDAFVGPPERWQAELHKRRSSAGRPRRR